MALVFMEVCVLGDTSTPTLDQVGGKGYHLHQMTRNGLPVPPGAVLTTELWQRYQRDPTATVQHLREQILPALVAELKRSNAGQIPPVSVRSSGAVSMPGMLDTVLNVAMTPDFLANAALPAPLSAELRARFLAMYGHTVLGMEKSVLEGVSKPFASTAKANAHYARIYRQHGHALPSSDPEEQILNCVLAVFDSWNTPRAQLYRQLHAIDDTAGTAVVIQRMVLGNRNPDSATGVVFSRNPSTGDPALFGEYLPQAQGEDVVSGSSTPLEIAGLEEDFPAVHAELKAIVEGLESMTGQVQDVEFTVEDGRLWILQSRSAKVSPWASVRLLMEQHQAGQLTAAQVLDRLTPEQVQGLRVRQVEPSYAVPPDGQGLPASTGVLCGRVVFGPSQKYKNDPTVFLARQTTPDDLRAMHQAAGFLTAVGGATSHAAVVARGMGKACVVGCPQLVLETNRGVESARLGTHRLSEGDWITLEASTGRVWAGRDVPVVDAQNTQLFWDLEDLVFQAHPDWTRVTSTADEIVEGKSALFLTYALDELDELALRRELAEAQSYLTGTIDLTGRLEAMEHRYPGMVLFADRLAADTFARKKSALLQLAQSNPPTPSTRFDLYLGPYEAAHADDLRSAGYRIRPSSQIACMGDRGAAQASWIIASEPDPRIPPHKLAISAGNALRALRARPSLSVTPHITFQGPSGQGPRRMFGGPFLNAPTDPRVFKINLMAEHDAPADLRLPIPDYGAPTDPSGFLAAFSAILKSPRDVYVGCHGGIGRTGLFMSCFLKHLGHPDPLGHVRAHYHPHAVETQEQLDFLADFPLGVPARPRPSRSRVSPHA